MLSLASAEVSMVPGGIEFTTWNRKFFSLPGSTKTCPGLRY